MATHSSNEDSFGLSKTMHVTKLHNIKRNINEVKFICFCHVARVHDMLFGFFFFDLVRCTYGLNDESKRKLHTREVTTLN